ncbi:MAG: ABC transporter substrate-binding protein, partial [Leptolyngbyaceae cyanobacterium CAN_BIN12]|nr:ABC transporter substrate-binding protein [Leptolyngbyaceae cyanobacterium CAN_BIN12]
MLRWIEDVGWRSLSLSLCFALLVPLTSCQPSLYKTQTAQQSQLILSTLSDPNTFNFANKNTFTNIFLFSYECLTNENGVTGEIEPALAESWQVSEDNKRVVFKLRPGLKWSDGH